MLTAGVTSLLFKLFKQPVVLGYIVAGMIAGPYMCGESWITDEHSVDTWSEIGVLFLLFALGLEFSFKKLLQIGGTALIAATTIAIGMMTLGFFTGRMFGWDEMNSLFLGGMLCMSSTTIVFKAINDQGLQNNKFANICFGILIVEDIFAVVLMVMLSSIAVKRSFEGTEMLLQVGKLAAYLVFWFVVGIAIIPTFLKRFKKYLNDETLTIFSIGLCLGMVLLAVGAGFSSALGAFVMGSVLAETVEAERIEHLVQPIKNVFGAIFFVSVGMMINPSELSVNWLPIVVISCVVIIGQILFGSLGTLLSGQTLKVSLQSGFSLVQIGEFAFIIASLGLTLGVTDKTLYPIVVAVSVLTTFLTPYMISWADPCYARIERRLPRRWIRRLNHLGSPTRDTSHDTGHWHRLIRKMLTATLIYSVLSVAVVTLMFSFFLPFVRQILPHWWANGVCGILTVVLISPFLRSIIMKHNHSEEFKALWTENRVNRLPLLFTLLARIAVATAFLFYICNYLARFANAIVITLALAVVMLMVVSRSLKRRSIRLERLFVQNLRSRDIEAQVHGRRRPLYEGRLLDHNLHIADYDIPAGSLLAGQTLRELQLPARWGIHVSSILRGHRRINIPGGDMPVFPGDRLQVIGTDEQLREFGNSLRQEVDAGDEHIEQREMKLRSMVIAADSPLAGKTLSQSGIREHYGCMAVGIEMGEGSLAAIAPSRPFSPGDVVWVVGEESALRTLPDLQR